MKQIILTSVLLLAFTACNSQGQKRTKTVKAAPAKKEDLIVEKKSLTKNIVPEKPVEKVPEMEKTIKFLPPATIDNETYTPPQQDAGRNYSDMKESFSMSIPPPPVQQERIMVVDEPAEFPGGTAALKKYLAQNLKYPQRAVEEEIEGKVYLKFIIRQDGSLTDIKIARNLSGCPECDAEAVRLVSEMPAFSPAKTKGKPVDCNYTLPVVFQIQ